MLPMQLTRPLLVVHEPNVAKKCFIYYYFVIKLLQEFLKVQSLPLHNDGGDKYTLDTAKSLAAQRDGRERRKSHIRTPLAQPLVEIRTEIKVETKYVIPEWVKYLGIPPEKLESVEGALFAILPEKFFEFHTTTTTGSQTNPQFF